MNKIVGVLGEDNRWRTSYVNVGCVFVDYFRQLFTIRGSDMSHGIFGEVAGRVTVEQGVTLNKPFSRGEIEAALKDMGPTKSLGPNGMPPLFYQKYWSVVGDTVISRCLEFLNGNGTVKDLNHTLIALIPKIPAPKKVTEYRPISLCNVIYKLISKAFANRLKVILPNVIADYQSVFVPGLLIHDNVIAAFETMYNLKRRGGKKSRQKAAIKLDMIKAYDRVEWEFWKGMMLAMGFPSRFIRLIMECVQLVSYFVLIQVQDCLKLKEIFAVYERALGQKISVEKSAVSFSPRTTRVVKESCSIALDMKIVPCHESYLGLPLVTERNKKKVFKDVADRVW
ncbi:hypothetical protein ACLB2K_041578 [Fragaria x ananassa]